MNTQMKLSKAKASLVLNQPFFASILMRMPFVESNVETISTDGEQFKFNSVWIDGVSLDHIKTVLCKLTLNIANFHHLRMQDRDADVWNQAANYSIVESLAKSGFYIPSEFDIETARAFGDQSAESIYQSLNDGNDPSDAQNSPDSDEDDEDDTNSQSTSGSATDDENEPSDEPSPSDSHQLGTVERNDMTPSEQQSHEQDVKTALAQAANIAKQQGKLTDEMKCFVDEMLQAKVDWKDALAQFMNEKARNDYSWKIPNKRFANLGLYLPSLESPEIGTIVVIMDTSGSISQREMNELAAEMKDIAATFKCEVKAVFCDSRVKHVQDVDEDTVLKPMGGGGTDYVPAFEWIEGNDIEPVCAVYLTDGWCRSFPDEPDFPVLWVLTERSAIERDYFNAPFGETILMS